VLRIYSCDEPVWDTEPHASARRNDQGAVEASAPNAEAYLLKLRLDSQQKDMEKMQAKMDAMQDRQEHVQDAIIKQEEALQSARAQTATSRTHEATTPSRPPGLMPGSKHYMRG
jgi:septal ring factor EnvC (AmiA/AmiB activator)